MQPQSKIDFETIQTQLKYSPILANFGILNNGNDEMVHYKWAAPGT